MSTVQPAETAALVLKFLVSSSFSRTAGTFRRYCFLRLLGFPKSPSRKHTLLYREASKTLKSINAPAGVKSLNDILNEYVKLKELSIKRQQLLHSNRLAADISAVLDQHLPSLASPVQQPQDVANDATEQKQQCKGLQLQPVQPQQHGSLPQAQQQHQSADAQLMAHKNEARPAVAAQQHDAATPAAQRPCLLPLTQLQASAKSVQSSRHRKQVPPRKRIRSGGFVSPVKPAHITSGRHSMHSTMLGNKSDMSPGLYRWLCQDCRWSQHLHVCIWILTSRRLTLCSATEVNRS